MPNSPASADVAATPFLARDEQMLTRILSAYTVSATVRLVFRDPCRHQPPGSAMHRRCHWYEWRAAGRTKKLAR